VSERKVLVVDDDIAILDVLEQAFTKWGYKTHTAESAEKALGTFNLN
jgi:DNA-binding NtrC family response regulator